MNSHHDDGNHAAHLLSLIRMGDWLDAQVFPDLKWTVPGVIPEGFGLVVGPPKLGKSWLVLGLALAVASGGAALGSIEVGPARPVLYLALEDGDRRLQKRSRDLLHGQPIPALFASATTLPHGKVLEVAEAWLAQHVGADPLVIVDTLGRVLPPAMAGESAYARDYRIGVALKTLTDRHAGATLLVVHHTRKAEGADWMDSTSGTQGLNGAADFTVALTRSRNESDAVLRVTGRDVMEAEYAMSMAGGAWSLQGDSLADAARAAHDARATQGLGDKSTAVLQLVNRHAEGIGPTAVAKILGDMTPSAAGTYLSRLESAGRIRKAARGLYASAVQSVETVEGGSLKPAASALSTLTCEACGEPLHPAVVEAGFPLCPSC